MRVTYVKAALITFVLTVSAFVSTLSMLAPSCPARPPDPPVLRQEQTHQEWVARCITEMRTVKVGMTRAQLLRVFSPEGGFPYYRTRQQLYYHGCPYFKVRVTFLPVGKDTGDNGNPSDRIASLSDLYLDHPPMPY